MLRHTSKEEIIRELQKQGLFEDIACYTKGKRIKIKDGYRFETDNSWLNSGEVLDVLDAFIKQHTDRWEWYSAVNSMELVKMKLSERVWHIVDFILKQQSTKTQTKEPEEIKE